MKYVACLALVALAACGRRTPADRVPPAHANIITSEDIERAPGLSIEQLLATRVPGISLTRATDGHMVIHIRGTSTINGEQEPLFVLNGIPLDSPLGGTLAAISPRDIDYIEVLRDAAGMAAYGSRGANGVIIIKTKQS